MNQLLSVLHRFHSTWLCCSERVTFEPMVISYRVKNVGCSSRHAKKSNLLWGVVAIAEERLNGGLGGHPVLAVLYWLSKYFIDVMGDL